MYCLDWLTAKGRARRKAEKLINGQDKFNVDVPTLLVCINGLRSVYLDANYQAAARDVYIAMNFTPEGLLKSISENVDMILNEEHPERRRYSPRTKRCMIKSWFWSDEDQLLDWEEHMTKVIDSADQFVRLLRDDYEISGKAVAGYRLEQMYYQLCDVITLTEAFYRKQ